MTDGKLLSIDHGMKRIGLAVCDASRLVARELTVIHRTTNVADFEKINHYVAEENVVGIVIGLPLNLDADPNVYSQADRVKNWVGRYSKTVKLPILLWDEQLSSEDAKELAKMQKRKVTDPIDDLAARVILQSYLDAFRDGLAPEI